MTTYYQKQISLNPGNNSLTLDSPSSNPQSLFVVACQPMQSGVGALPAAVTLAQVTNGSSVTIRYAGTQAVSAWVTIFGK